MQAEASGLERNRNLDRGTIGGKIGLQFLARGVLAVMALGHDHHAGLGGSAGVVFELDGVLRPGGRRPDVAEITRLNVPFDACSLQRQGVDLHGARKPPPCQPVFERVGKPR